jgi:hypothetical protein
MMAMAFDVKLLEERVAALEMAATFTKKRNDLRLVDRGLSLAEEAIGQDDYDRADTANEVALNAARAMKHQALIGWIENQSERIKKLKTEYERIKPLPPNPQDPATNLTVGRFLCLVKGDWFRGARFLATSSDKELAAIAAKDVQTRPDAGDRVGLGLAWWEQAEKVKDKDHQEQMRARARYWFGFGLKDASEADRKRIDELLKTVVGNFEGRPGFVAEFFSDRDLKHRAKVGVSSEINHFWKNGPPNTDVPADNFSIRWEGWVVPPDKGPWRCMVLSNDGGLRVWVDGIKVMDTWDGNGQGGNTSAEFDNPRRIRIEYRRGTKPDGFVQFILQQPGRMSGSTTALKAMYHDKDQAKLLEK